MAEPRVSVVQEGAYLTYPHGSGFYEGGASLVVGESANGSCRLLAVPLVGVGQRELCLIEGTRLAYFDVARERELVAGVWHNAVWLIDLRGAARPERLYAPPKGATLQELPSISARGDRVIVCEQTPGTWACVSVDTRTGRAHTLFRQGWYANHFHLCPNDEGWVGFCHEGKTETIPDRVWAWHEQRAPEGRCIFDQRCDDETTHLFVGHERWAFHDTSAYVVAYGVSPCGPRGLWQVWPEGREPRLVSGADRDWHCDVSRDGRRAVVDTSGPHDRPGRGWEAADGVSDILLISTETGERTFLARTGMAEHPHHPHPVFTPDGKRVLFNHTAWVRGQMRPCVMSVNVEV